MVDIAFAGSPLDRADHVRADPSALEALKANGARLLLLDGLFPHIGDANRLSWAGLDAAPDGVELVFLGLGEDGAGHFAPVAPSLAGSAGALGQDLWDALRRLDMADLATYGGARSLVDWHARHGFCARCGARTRLAKGGWQRNCTSEACGAEHFPRVDPVTIMIVEHEGRLLLGRQPRFAPGFYSALAGFVEPGESIEEAVRREVFEEAGVRVSQVDYVASQPWPFPSSLMIGCHAMAATAEIRVDETELEDARWFAREEILAAVRGDEGAAFEAPPRRAIARQLLEWWLER